MDLRLPIFESPSNVESFKLLFNPLAGMHYSCDVALPIRAPPGTFITIGRVFRCIDNAVHAPLQSTALLQDDPLRELAKQAFRSRTGRTFDPSIDVLRNVDLHMVGRPQDAHGLYFHGITVAHAGGTYGPYPVFRVLLRDYPPVWQ